jgi:large subunit ribosomal protein L10
MPTAQKAQTIDALAEQFSRAQLTIVADYRGLTVSDLQTLRGNLRPFGAEFHIAKNTLAKIAATNAGIEGLDPVLEGPTAIVLAYDDIIGPSKAVSDFARISRILSVKGGVMNQKFIPPSDVEAMASLPSRDVILARLVGMLQSPMARTVGVLGGPGRSMAYLLQARVDQLAGESAAAAAD